MNIAIPRKVWFIFMEHKVLERISMVIKIGIGVLSPSVPVNLTVTWTGVRVFVRCLKWLQKRANFRDFVFHSVGFTVQ